jgi:energy-converting hydrogenase Eha subunit C
MAVSKSIQIGEFIRGMEVLILVTYQFITLSKVSLILYSCWVSFGVMLNRKKSLLQLSVISLIVFSVSVWMNSYNMAYFLSLAVGSYILLPFSILILLLAALGRLLQKRKAEGDAI